MSYMNLRELCMCLFYMCIFRMSYMYPQEVVCVYFVCSTWLYENFICVFLACVLFICPACIHKKYYMHILYALHESMRILYVSFCMCIFCMSYMNLRELCMCLFWMCIFGMSYMNLQKLFMCLFCLCIFLMSYMNLQKNCMFLFCMCTFHTSYMYPQEVLYVYFVCPTWIYKNFVCDFLYMCIFHMSYMNLWELCVMCVSILHGYVAENNKILYVLHEPS